MKTMKVYPNPKLPEHTYLKGVGADGAELPEELAQAMVDAGLAVKTKPKPPEPPAEKSEDK